MQPNANILIDTPENVLLEAEIAGFATRCMAAIIDYLILLVVLIGVTWIFIQSVRDMEALFALGFYVILQFLIITFYHLFFEFLWNGQTPGKRALKIRVVQGNGMPLTTAGGVIRNLVRLFDFFPIGYGIGLIVLFATRNTQRLGDLAAGTVVVRERGKLKLSALQDDQRVIYRFIAPQQPIPPNVQIAQLTADERRITVQFLQRREMLRARAETAIALANDLVFKMTGTSGSFISPIYAETFLEQVVRAFEVAEYEPKT
jgi:uncharacterized RDD family membrane protein YckC